MRRFKVLYGRPNFAGRSSVDMLESVTAVFDKFKI